MTEEGTHILIWIGIGLWMLFAYYAVKHEEELRDIWKSAKDLVDSLLGEDTENEEDQ